MTVTTHIYVPRIFERIKEIIFNIIPVDQLTEYRYGKTVNTYLQRAMDIAGDLCMCSTFINIYGHSQNKGSIMWVVAWAYSYAILTLEWWTIKEQSECMHAWSTTVTMQIDACACSSRFCACEQPELGSLL